MYHFKAEHLSLLKSKAVFNLIYDPTIFTNRLNKQTNKSANKQINTPSTKQTNRQAKQKTPKQNIQLNRQPNKQLKTLT